MIDKQLASAGTAAAHADSDGTSDSEEQQGGGLPLTEPERAAAVSSAVTEQHADTDLAVLPARETDRPKWRRLRKPQELILIHEIGAGLGLVDRKLFNCLLCYAAEDVKRFGINEPYRFEAQTRYLRKDMGLKTSTSDGQLRVSLEKLTSERFIFRQARNFQTPAVGTLVEKGRLEKGSGIIRWSFPRWFELDPYEYETWGDINIDTCAKFRSKYAIILYELMCTLVNRKYSRDTVLVDDLRELLGTKRPAHALNCSTECSPDKLASWSALHDCALKPAVDEINRYAHFTVTMTPQRGRRGRKIETVSFVVSKKAERHVVPLPVSIQ